jgi:hypothetical protein
VKKTSVQLVVLVALLGVLGYVGHLVLDDAKPDKKVGASYCENAIPCPNHCLKAEDPGWMKMDVKGHPDTDVWMKFTAPNGDWEAYNQNHVGHVIALVNGRYTDTGVCPVCRGTTRVCPPPAPP